MLVPALSFLLLIVFEDTVGQIVLLCIAAAFNQMTFCCGFFISHSDLVGEYAGLLYGLTDMMSQFSGVCGSLSVAAFTPNVTMITSLVYIVCT